MRKFMVWFGLDGCIANADDYGAGADSTLPWNARRSEGLQRRRSQALPRYAGPGRYGGAGLPSAAATQIDPQMPGGATEAWAVIQRL
jgi:hypothetical protein